MTVAASVLHPSRAGVELLSAGVKVTPKMLRRLTGLGVNGLWVHHDATADLDRVIDPNLGKTRRAVYDHLKADFAATAGQTISSGRVARYRELVMDLVCELIANRRVAGLTEHLAGGPGGLFTHCASVAYLSVLLGVELENYIIDERTKLGQAHARDLTALGVGAMLHDVGKLANPEDELEQVHGTSLGLALSPARAKAYLGHCLAGYTMLRGSRAPASATQVVLTHHQRFDGKGFPTMDKATHGRQVGTQAGKKIHVFSRIVAAANTLVNLTRDGRDGYRPIVAGLSRLANGEFDGWFDPIVLASAVRKIPPFAVGARVVLSDGQPAGVIAPSLKQPCRPSVRLLAESTRHADGSYPTLNLREHPELSVAQCEGRDVSRWLFELPDPGYQVVG